MAPSALQAQNQAAVQLLNDKPHFHPGEEVSFLYKLNEPLPEGAHFDARLSPVDVSQNVILGSGEPTDKDRREFVIKFTIPDHARGGEWHLVPSYLFLPGASYVYNAITPNDLRFYVDGPTGPIPSSAVATIIKK